MNTSISPQVGDPVESKSMVDKSIDSPSGKNEGDNTSQNQMFTSMSDIGFPSNIHNYNLKVNK